MNKDQDFVKAFEACSTYIENEIGYCGSRKKENGKLVGVSPEDGKLSWYVRIG